MKKYAGRLHERWWGNTLSRNRQIAETDEENYKEEKIISVRFYYVMKELLHVKHNIDQPFPVLLLI